MFINSMFIQVVYRKAYDTSCERSHILKTNNETEVLKFIT